MAGSKSGPQGHSRVCPQPPPRTEQVCAARGTGQSFRRTFASVCISAPAEGDLVDQGANRPGDPRWNSKAIPFRSYPAAKARAAALIAMRPCMPHAVMRRSRRSGMRSRSKTDLIEFGPCIAPPNIEVPVQIEICGSTLTWDHSCFGAHNAVDFVERGRLVEHGKPLSRPPDGGGGIEQFLAIKVD